MKLKKLHITASASLGLLLTNFAVADSDLSIGVGPPPAPATANLDFRITIPQFVYFRVGNATPGTVDEVHWDLTGAQVGQSGTPIAATTNGAIGVELITNAPSVTISSNTAGGVLSAGGGLNIPFTEINVSDGGVIPAPGFDLAAPALLSGTPIAILDTWTFTYDDDTVYMPGVYTGTSIYTAATP
jgi:hypothetical protein